MQKRQRYNRLGSLGCAARSRQPSKPPTAEAWHTIPYRHLSAHSLEANKTRPFKKKNSNPKHLLTFAQNSAQHHCPPRGPSFQSTPRSAARAFGRTDHFLRYLCVRVSCFCHGLQSLSWHGLSRCLFLKKKSLAATFTTAQAGEAVRP